MSVTVNDLGELIENGHEDSLLRQFAMKQVLFYIRMLGWDAFTDLKRYMERDAENAIELFELYTMMDETLETVDPATWEDECQWHVHIDIPKCTSK